MQEMYYSDFHFSNNLSSTYNLLNKLNSSITENNLRNKKLENELYIYFLLRYTVNALSFRYRSHLEGGQWSQKAGW